ncbi:phytanoyl-CoA dioxygenase family protein [Gammaproteobacteria bacterium]|nr:phytanoyl-CoA dioxygenase family protein [SAR86 cluster bacterium]MDB4816111.1 phytanoyl-CoA dioxygenase family protein [Gammaproteobacteria bacterium]MDC0546275.1 phytanoyl-CoA dioxygenase family protein [Gammaproteobacteria bacterium]MDC3323397.1 phytanoyl-CoA dioxygenase family protein [Gammaproteobacteria bacterium]
MAEIKEFTQEYIDNNSPEKDKLFQQFLDSQEPYTSIFKNNPWLLPPDFKKPLESGDHFWNTTVGRKHPYWKNKNLPKPTKEITQIRKDFQKWGYALIEEGMSKKQCKVFIDRLLEQAEGEKLANVNSLTPSGQYVHTLINKGKVFRQCIEQDIEAVQAGALIENFLNETLGKGWICHSFLANGAEKGYYPQVLHIDQSPLSPWITEEAPALVNTLYIPQDVNEENGGTLIIPGSHKNIIKAGSNGNVGKLNPAINLEANAGTIMLFDGRLLHGTGVNKTSKIRFVAAMSNVKSWMRSQENWIISVDPEIIKNASPKLLHRMGMQAVTYGGTIEGFGIGAAGKVDESRGSIKYFREAFDEGEYIRVGELSSTSPKSVLKKNYTLRQAMKKAKSK